MAVVEQLDHGKGKNMIKFSKYISEDGTSKVESAISKAESKTSCEIVPVVIDYADDYLHASLLFGFIFSLLSFSIAWFIFSPGKAKHYFWPSEFQLEYLVNKVTHYPYISV